VQIVLDAPISVPEVSNTQTLCFGSVIGQIAIIGYGTEWYDAPSGGNLLLPTMPIPLGTHTFYAQQQGASLCESSRVPVDVTITTDFCTVELGLKVFLQGVALPNGSMTTYLQTPLYPTYTPNLALPKVSPYEVHGAYEQINDESGPAGKVVDWILVEIWGNFSSNGYYTDYDLLESQALLLQSDGNVVTPSGLTPRFIPYLNSDIRIVIKHRNHLTVMSNLITLDEDIEYDFTTDVNKAFKSPYAYYPSMIIPFNEACMWAGDVNGDSFIDNVDVTLYTIHWLSGYFGIYVVSDLNMDGFVDNVDGSILQLNAKYSLFSPVVYFKKR
jgi:hypothetical protein